MFNIFKDGEDWTGACRDGLHGLTVATVLESQGYVDFPFDEERNVLSDIMRTDELRRCVRTGKEFPKI